jgi:hypothetical protein
MPRELGVAGLARQFLGELVGCGADPQPQFLRGALYPQLPAVVPEIPLDLRADARLGVGSQIAADPGVEIADRLHQPQVPGLDKVLGELRADAVTGRAGADNALMPAYQGLAGRLPLQITRRPGTHHRDELPVTES